MALRALKLGTRRSLLARAQSAAVAAQLQQLHPDLSIELIGIDTRGDRLLDIPLAGVEGKEFFTDELDAALLDGRVDFTVHSYKDLSLDRTAKLRLAAVPRRQWPHDLVVFAHDVPERLEAGHELRIGSSSPRRASFVPGFLQQVLPQCRAEDRSPPRVSLHELRGNVDTRLRRLHEPRGSARHLDGIVLAFAGLARLWSDGAGQALLRQLFAPLPHMLLPLSACPAAPAQGALALECRLDDAPTAALLAALDDPSTRQAVAAERALLAVRGGGCQQRFGATQIELPGLGALMYERSGDDADAGQNSPPPRWSPEPPLLPAKGAIRAWDGSQAERAVGEPVAAGIRHAAECLETAAAVFVAHQWAWPDSLPPPIHGGAPIWVPGTATWRALAARGVWVDGSADGLGFAALAPLLAEPLLQLPPMGRWTVFTHQDAVAGWPAREVIATYRHAPSPPAAAAGAPPAEATHLFWSSGAQFERWGKSVGGKAQHACGPGRTHEHLCRAGVQNLRVFPQAAHWRQWLGL
ncbi:MAG TPA: hydroxymethylbilane synthase [Steroidobacteraceae bacterium]|jgi:hydroxymethylbilane synthase